MAFKEIVSLDADITIAIGGFNKKAKKDNPTGVAGYYLGSRQVPSPKAKSGFAAIHYFQTEQGNVGVWGKTDMDRKLKSAQLGWMTEVEFEKMVPSKNGDMYKYVVRQDDDNTIDVSGIASEPRVAQAEESEELESEEIDEDAEQAAHLAALERKAKVEAMLKGKKKVS